MTLSRKRSNVTATHCHTFEFTGDLKGGKMPLLELSASNEGRLRVFARAQLPFTIFAAIVGATAVVVIPDVWTRPLFIVGLVLVAFASTIATAFPWERFSPNWMISVAVIDIVASAFLRAETYPTLTGVGLLVIFPALWLSYGFRPQIIAVAIAGAAFVTAFPFLVQAQPPETEQQWANVAILPIAVILIAIAVRTAAAQLNHSRLLVIENSERMTQALRDSRDREAINSTIFETVDAAMAYYDADQNLVVANKSATELVGQLGFRLDEPPYAGVNVFAADRVTRIPLEDQIIPRALRGEVVEGHVEWLGPPGDQRAIVATSGRAYRPSGEFLGTVIATYDVTELANAVRVREEFLATVSHELRTPLTSILGYLELLEEEIDMGDETAATYFRVISSNGSILLSRVDQLISLSDRMPELRLQPTDITELVAASVDSIRPVAASRGLDIRAGLEPGLIARADEPRLRQALENLLSNAIKYSKSTGAIAVTVSRDQDHVIVSIADEGVGMTPQDQRQVFDRFFRSDSARLGAIQGIGIGLSLVKEIVEAHHGTIDIASEAGSGTTITVTLPAV